MKLLLILGLFICFSCIQSPENSRRTNATNIENPDNGDDKAASPDFSNTGNVSWFSTLVDGKTVTLSADSAGDLANNIIKLRGKKVHDYLKSQSSSENYCLVIHKTQVEPRAVEQLRLIAFAEIIVDFQNSTNEYALRVELLDDQIASSSCIGTIALRNSAGGAMPTLVSHGSNEDVAFSVKDLCINDNCNNATITSNAVSLYKSVSNQINDMDIISLSDIELNTLGIKVQYSLSIDKNPNSCSEDDLQVCSDQGFDCCNEGQCVTDGTLKSNIVKDDHPEAIEDVENNFATYKRWPDVYNVCE